MPKENGSGRFRPVGAWLWENTATRGGLVFVGAATVVNVSNFLFHVLISRMLGPVSYGALGALLNLTTVVSVPLAALGATVVQSVAQRQEGAFAPLGRLLRVSLVAAVTGVLLWTAATPTIDRFFHLTSPRATVVLGFWLLPSIMGAVLGGVLIGQRRFRVVALSQLVGTLLGRLAFGVLLVKLGLGVTGAVVATLIGSTLSCLILLPPLRDQLRWHGTFAPRGRDASLTAVSLAGTTVLLGLDTWLARHFLPALAAGDFAAAATAGRIALFLPAAITVVYFPQLAASGGEGPAARRALARCVSLVALVSFGAAGAVVFFKSSTVNVLFGSAFTKSASAVGIIALADAAIAVANCLVYFHVARRSRLALSAWPTSILAALLAALFHGSIVVLALDMLAASVFFLLGLGIPTALSVLQSLAETASSLPRVAAMLDDSELDLTIVVPFRNVGVERLRSHIVGICDVLALTGATFEVVPVSDGSTDGSEQALFDLHSSLVRPIAFVDNRGKGEALRAGLAKGRGEYLGFIDGDGDIPARVLADFVTLARSRQPDIVVGSKRHPDSNVAYPPLRHLGSFAYQLLARALFGLKVRDTQTGVKLVRRDVLAEVLPRMVEKRYAFDLELLAVAQRLGYRRAAELPVEISERFTSTITFRAVWGMLQDTLATFYRMRILKFYDAPLALPEGSGDSPAPLVARPPQRILVCNWRDLAHPHAGGAEVYTHSVASEWVKSGHFVTWFTSEVEGRPSLEVVDGIHIIRRGGRHTVYRHARKFFERQGRGRFDLVIDEVNTRPFGAARWAAGTPVVALVHQVSREVWFHEMSWPVALLGRFWLEPRWLHRLRAVPVLTVSESSRASLQAYGIPDVWVVPGGQHPLEQPTTERERVPTMVFVGRLVSNKRPDDVLAAFRLVRRRLADAQLWMVGSGPLEEQLRRKAPEGVTFLGRLPEQEKIERLARAHALVATSVREGWGLTVSEAAQVGTPAVAYNVAGLRDSVSATGGLLVDPDPQALADALIEHLPRWTGGDLPPVRQDAVAPWADVAETFFTVASEGLISTAERAARDEQADVGVAWRRLLVPVASACDRRAWSVAGIAALLAVAPLSEIGASVWEGRLAGTAFLCFAMATVGAIAEAVSFRPQSTNRATNGASKSSVVPPSPLSNASAVDSSAGLGRSRRIPGWLVPMAIVVAISAMAFQIRFIGGPIARGDITPPVGTAWLARLFSPWVGSNLGGPSTGALDLPWAIVDGMVHALGGSGALAQRVWLTGLFAGVGAGAVALLSALELGTFAAVAGALVYTFNAYVVATVGSSDVYLAALGLVPALAAWVIVSARARHVWWWLLAMVPAATMLGLVAENPPLVLACAAALLGGPLLVGWLYGKELFRAAIRRTTLGIGVLVAASAYWLVPYTIQIVTTSAATVGAARSWTWTEGRATLANGFWLNTVWGWIYPAYYPYEHYYQQFPLVFVKFLLPVAAFAALGLGGLRASGSRLRLIAASSVVALALVLLSTGTRFPGASVFDLLYSLPYGWLLQEPGRFLFGTGLAYGVLVATALDVGTSTVRTMADGDPGSVVRRSGGRRVPVLPAIGIAVLLLPAFPLVLKASSDHAAVPAYWETMTTFVNQSSPPGNVLVLPEDDFYQMPYTWYYGNDGFISNMISRDVINPVGQGYGPAPSELIGAVGLLQNALLSSNWRQATAVAQALDARAILVRGDIESHYPGRHIADPASLDTALTRDPNVRLIDRSGPLDLFAFRQPLGQLTHPVTVGSRTPDLALLSILPLGSALVTSPPLGGAPAVIEPPPLDQWAIGGDALATTVLLPSSRRYEVAALSDRETSGLLPLATTGALGAVNLRLNATPHKTTLTLSAPLGPALIADGSFANGPWQPVGNCNNADGRGTKAPIASAIVPAGGPNDSRYLALSAASDSACVSTAVSWHSGPILISMMVRHVTGAPPRMCLWEGTASPGQTNCASASALPSAKSWTAYSTVIEPSSGVQSLRLFLYGDGSTIGESTVDDYADVQVYSYPQSTSQLAILATPSAEEPAHLVSNRVSYSSNWNGPTGSVHALVDGMENGWISTRPPGATRPYYALADIVIGVELTTGLGLSILLCIIIGNTVRRRYRHAVSRRNGAEL